MGEDEPFRVTVKDSAKSVNQAVRSFIDSRGQTVEFPSEHEAHTTADRLSKEGDAAVRIQQVAPQDPRNVDGYLIKAPERRTHDPERSRDDGYRFDVSAQQYGALGESLIVCYQSNPNALMPYIRSDLQEVDFNADPYIEVDSDPDPVIVDGDHPSDRMQWRPDCGLTARNGKHGRILARYLCEIKTGQASYERAQRTVMRRKAGQVNVLAVRLDITALPDSYSIMIEKVAPSACDGDSTIVYQSTRLYDFKQPSE